MRSAGPCAGQAAHTGCPGTGSCRCGCRCGGVCPRLGTAASPRAGWCDAPCSRSTCGPGPGPRPSTWGKAGVRAASDCQGGHSLPHRPHRGPGAQDSHGESPAGPRAVIHGDKRGAAIVRNLPHDRDRSAGDAALIAKDAWGERQKLGGCPRLLGPSCAPHGLLLPSQARPPPGPSSKLGHHGLLERMQASWAHQVMSSKSASSREWPRRDGVPRTPSPSSPSPQGVQGEPPPGLGRRAHPPKAQTHTSCSSRWA